MATVLPGAQVSPSGDQGPQGAQGVPGPSGPVGTGSGDVNGPASSIDNEMALFNATTGKLLKRSTGTGYLKVTSGVLQTPAALTKADVGLSNVDNTSDANKPVSTAQQTALNLKQDMSAKGNANGYASLDSGGKIPAAQLPPLTGTGDVVGPASSVDSSLVKFSGTTGKLIAQISKTGLTTDFLDGTNNYQDLATAVKPVIWNQRYRNFNAVGNPNFEIDQWWGGLPGAGWGSSGGYYADRWWNGSSSIGTARFTLSQEVGPVTLPGTSYVVAPSFFRHNLTTRSATLAAGDYYTFAQSIEGPRFRELNSEGHSFSLLVRSNVANLKFSVVFVDAAAAPNIRSLAKLCTIPNANTWTWITMPNLPQWPSAGTFPSSPGTSGYYFYIGLACGTQWMAPSNDSWIVGPGGYVGAVGMDNWVGKPLGSTFDIAYVQHEPGTECTPPKYISFEENYSACRRYYQKSFNYLQSHSGSSGVFVGAVTAYTYDYHPLAWQRFEPAMCKAPAMQAYSPFNGQANCVYAGSSINYATTSAIDVGEKGFGGFTVTPYPTSVLRLWYWHWTADAGI